MLMTRTRSRRLVLGVLAVAGFVAASLAQVPTAGAAAWTAPSFVRAIGGHGEPGVYAWGITYNPVSHEILVSDYLNFEIRRYDLNGNLLGSFYRDNSVGQPYSLAVDPRNGDIYVPELATGGPSGQIAKYDKAGNYLSVVQTHASTYWCWIAVDKDGYLYVVDDHLGGSTASHKIRKFDPAGNQVLTWGTYGAGAGQIKGVNGIAVSDAGNVYLADPVNRKILEFTTAGTWVRDFGGPGTGLGQLSGDVRGLAVDNVNGWLYAVDSNDSQIEKYTLTGTPILHWGSSGTDPGQFADGGRQVTIGPDGSVWVADYGNFRFEKFSPTGALLGVYPNPAQPAPLGGFAQPRDVSVDPVSGNVWVIDSWNERFQELSPTGAFLGAWGIRNSNAPYGMDYPRGIAVDPVTRNVWVANTRAQVIRIYDQNANYIKTLGVPGKGAKTAGYFNWPMDIQFAGGKAYVGSWDSGTKYIKVLDAGTGTELSQINSTTSVNGLAIDPATGNVFVASATGHKVNVYTPTGTLVTSFGTQGSGDGQFQSPWGIAIVNGVVYVSDVQNSRLQAFTTAGVFLGKWGGLGSGAYQFSNPSGIATDASGKLYIDDAGNDRVLVFSTTVPKPNGDVVKPTVAISGPTNGATLPAAEVVITGTATDAAPFGVAKVELAVQDTTTGMWWNAGTSTWRTDQTWGLAPMVGASSASVTYAGTFVGIRYGGHYTAYARSTDVSGMVSAATPSVSFSLVSSAPDTTPPTSNVTSPTLDATVPSGVVAIQGSANDLGGVQRVEIAIRDRNLNKWFNFATGTFTSQSQLWSTTTLGSPNGTVTTWSFALNHPTSGGSGSYYVVIRAADLSGNVQPSPYPFTRFSIA
jgi:DNA-binding beta-propeller fold protein YncE